MKCCLWIGCRSCIGKNKWETIPAQIKSDKLVLTMGKSKNNGTIVHVKVPTATFIVMKVGIHTEQSDFGMWNIISKCLNIVGIALVIEESPADNALAFNNRVASQLTKLCIGLGFKLDKILLDWRNTYRSS